MYDSNPETLRLNPEDIARVAEFFDCDVAAAFRFARTIWLPDARTTAVRIMRAVRARDWTSLLYLCDHLREGARCVGAQRIVTIATAIDEAAKRKHFAAALANVRQLRRSLEVLAILLLDCAEVAV